MVFVFVDYFDWRVSFWSDDVPGVVGVVRWYLRGFSDLVMETGCRLYGLWSCLMDR